MVSKAARRRHETWRRLRRAEAGGRHETLIAGLRAQDELLPRLGREATGVTVRPAAGSPVPCLWFEPDGADPDRLVQFHHGGGYAFGSPASHRVLAGHLAVAAGCPVVSVGYRLAPEHPFPAGRDDAVAVYSWLRRTYPAATIGFAGDSAGAGITLAALLRLRAEAAPLPATVVMSPWVDLQLTGDSLRDNATSDLLLDVADLRRLAAAYAGAADLASAELSPVNADLTGFPALLIQAGGDELLVDDARRLAARATAAGVPVHLEVFPKMQHAFQLSVGTMPEADEAIAEAGEFLRRAK
jgi:acetyl esterase/lipase